MKVLLSVLLIFYSIFTYSQEKISEIRFISFDYCYQLPIGNLSESFGNNSSLGMTYLQNKNSFLYGIDANFMFGNQVKNDSIFKLIETQSGDLINSSGELDEILYYERGFNTHFLLGKSYKISKNNSSQIYVYAGLGYLQHKIKIESNRTTLPQITENYMKGYDNFTNGISSKMCIKYLYFDRKTDVKLYLGTEFIYAYTKNKRPYNFGEMEYKSKEYKSDKLVGFNFGIIIPINKKNDEKFHYY